MMTDPEQTSPENLPHEDEADTSGGGYGNHGDAGEEEQDRREVGG
ncbi:hypothetical protein [Sphingomonas yabuuchiae]|nr:hypothetical protein [Sphingomonas yabuuchiae]